MGSQTSRFGGATPPARPATPLRAMSAASSRADRSLPLVGAILNPKSHRNKQIRRADFGIPGVITVFPRTKPEIVQALEDFAAQKIGYLAIGGGDGTVRDVLTRAAGIFGEGDWPEIIILPRGKTNALAIDLGLPSRWSLCAALEAAKRGRTVTRQPLILESLDDDVRTRYGFILGAGVFNAAIAAGQVAHRFGAFQSFAVGVTAAFGVLQALCGLGEGPWRRQYGMRLDIAGTGQPLPMSMHGKRDTRFLATFSTLTRFPLGLKPFGSGERDRPIRYFLLDAPMRRAIAALPRAMFSDSIELLDRHAMHRGEGDAFDVEFADGFILDGEIFQPGAFRLKAGPDMRFVVP